jgi:hypothetical protein
VGPRAGMAGCGKSRLPGFDSRTVQPVASRYIYIYRCVCVGARAHTRTHTHTHTHKVVHFADTRSSILSTNTLNE